VFSVVVIMIVVLLVAVGVVLYAAYPARHQKVPGVPWLGEAVEQLSDAVPTLDEFDADPSADESVAPRA
jgi:hypothetical protein